eukprot:SAG22_NODE_802_length_7099_cov_122.579429_4_plen_249_part_00
MADAEEEQEMELEALAAIFMDEFVPDDVEPSKMFKVVINKDEIEGLSANLSVAFKYTADYPNEPPEFEIAPTMQLTNDQKTRMKEAMQAVTEEEIGTVMVFTMISAAKEYLETMFEEPAESEPVIKIATQMPAEQRGTPVTKENFKEWNAKYMAELRASGAYIDPAATKKGLSGRELFEGGLVVEEDPDAAAGAAEAAGGGGEGGGDEPAPADDLADLDVDEDLFDLDDEDMSSDDEALDAAYAAAMS